MATTAEVGGSANIAQRRKRRWQRRASDGADWNYRRSAIKARRSDDKRDGQSRRRRGGRLSSAIRNAARNEPLLHREPWRLTEDVRDRLAAAGRASATTFATFALLIYSGQEFMPVGWLGNILALSTLGPTLGGTIVSVKNVLVPLVPIGAAGWGASYLLGMLSTTLYSILLPFVVLLGCLVITLCPWPFLTMKNLMLVVFFLLVASPLAERDALSAADYQEDFGLLFVPGVVGTCCVGLAVSVSVHVFLIPFPRSTTAARSAKRLVRRLKSQSDMFLRSVAEYTKNIGIGSKRARQQRTLIEFYVTKRQQTLEHLKANISELQVEPCTSKSDIDTFQAIMSCSTNQQRHAELVQLATTQQFLGEVVTTQSNTLRDVKSTFAANLGGVLEELVHSYERASENVILCSNPQEDKEISNRLNACIDNYRVGMKGAVSEAEKLLVDDDAASHLAAGAMIRQRIAFHGVYNFVYELLDILQDANHTETKQEFCTRCKTHLRQSASALKLPWLWGDISKRRLAAKTSLALVLASLWVSIPYLRNEVAYPNSIWVGITVSTVSLESTGSSVTKAVGRLWGTLLAGGFALLIDKLLVNDTHLGDLALMTAFTFAASFVGTNSDNPYAARYAATSMGSMLYGSFENNMALGEYVPQRIMLIFTGALTALFVETIVFPRSSRTIVQANALQFFEDLEHALQCSRDAVANLQNTFAEEKKETDNMLVEDNPLWMLRKGNERIPLPEDVLSAHSTLEKTHSQARKELKPGIAEPVIGGVRLHIGGYEALLSEQKKILCQLDLLAITIKSLIGYYSILPENHPIHSMQVPDFLSSCLDQTIEQLCKCIDGLREVFPHGLLRPGESQMSSIIRAVSAFRGFEDVVLALHDQLAHRLSSFLRMLATERREVYVPGLRLTTSLAKSAVLTINTSLKKCGAAIETIVKSFPEDDGREASAPGSPDSDDDDATEDQPAEEAINNV